ncbi:hypothetical protein GKZ68_05160 [Hymenobacter sp. BRD128]|uniref:hypothetical protein n=1 Tax=Hymenobacter sp. BRD128 TaxID=2675878 RepID=UPI001563D550|nr:hypothetical protein [Hymenobacter sp. BRD128]QKG56081.1 hypothetical protein GKZ68_05160 [Hymenobacter sp. BRD128]
MKNILFIVTLAISLGLILFLYWQLTLTQNALKDAQVKVEACQQVTFQLQAQLSADEKSAAAHSTTAPSASR